MSAFNASEVGFSSSNVDQIGGEGEVSERYISSNKRPELPKTKHITCQILNVSEPLAGMNLALKIDCPI